MIEHDELKQKVMNLHGELVKHMDERDYPSFDEAIKRAKTFCDSGKLPFCYHDLANQLADLEIDGKNLLHMAAEVVVTDENTMYFVRLIDMKFPLYHTDCNGDFPTFILTNIKNDQKFATSYYALIDKGFNLNYPNPEGLTFLQKLLMTSNTLTMGKINAILKTRPDITEDDYNEIKAKMQVNWVRINSKQVKQCLSMIKQYILKLDEYKSQQNETISIAHKSFLSS